MKYLYYMFVLFTVILRRLIFPLVYVAIPFRKWLRNYVYNWHLQKDIKLKRLWERKPYKIADSWKLNNLHGPSMGIVHKRKVNPVIYYLVALPLWLLLDDDAMADTYDAGFNKTIINGKRKTWMPNFIKDDLEWGIIYAEHAAKGNSFDLGDNRSSLYEFWSVFWWTLRNPAYNFNYKFNQMVGDKYTFKIVIFNRLFGWDEDGMLDGVQTYSWEFGKEIK